MNKFNFKNTFNKSTPDFHNRILTTLNNLPEQKEIINMKKSKFFKRAIAVVAVAVVMTTTAAAGNIVVTKYYRSSNSPSSEFTTLPTPEELKKDYDFEFIPLDSFSNGYTFIDGRESKALAIGENEEKIAEFQKLSINYVNSDNEIAVSVSSYHEDITNVGMNSEYSETYNDVEIYYNNDTYKLIDSDYVMTEQDKIDMESGKYVFGVGGGRNDGIVSDIVVSDLQFISWIDNDLCFLIMAENSDLSQDDLIDMAKEYIDAND